MPGKPNSKWMESMIAKLGSREAVSEYMRSNGRRGGQNGNTGGFTDRELAARAGQVGGRISRRGPKRIAN